MSHMPVVSGGSPHNKSAGYVYISHGHIMRPNWQGNKFEQPHSDLLDRMFFFNNKD